MIGIKEGRRAVDYKKPERNVRFRFFKAAMDVQTPKAWLIKLGNVSSPIEVWVPKSRVTVEDDPEDDGYYVVTMPEWLYLRTELPEYTEAYPAEEAQP